MSLKYDKEDLNDEVNKIVHVTSCLRLQFD